MKITLVILKVLFLAALFIIYNNNFHIIEKEDRKEFYSLYFQWFGDVFDNSLRITNYVIKSNWLPDRNLSLNESNNFISNKS